MGARFVARGAPFLGNSEATSKARSKAAVSAAVEERSSGSRESCRLEGVFGVIFSEGDTDERSDGRRDQTLDGPAQVSPGH